MNKYTFNIQPNPALDPIKERVKTQGRWNTTALYPTEAKRLEMQPRQKVYIIERDDRRFAVVAPDRIAAENQITNL
jgi:hypothetical protein